jgi:hypothetical protein
MKFIFRNLIVFEYEPTAKYQKVKQVVLYDTIPAFNHCSMIPEDYRLLSEFFDKVYRHINGEDVDLKDIEVN